jgi:hypothetical protein
MLLVAYSMIEIVLKVLFCTINPCISGYLYRKSEVSSLYGRRFWRAQLHRNQILKRRISVEKREIRVIKTNHDLYGPDVE